MRHAASRIFCRLSVALPFALLALAAGLEAQSQQTPVAKPDANGFIPQATIAEIMESMLMPAADAIWSSVSVTVSAEGTFEKKPETEEDWERLRWHAVALAEAANSLIIPGREVDLPGAHLEYPEEELKPAEIQALLKTQWPAWVAHAQVLHGMAMETIRAIDATNVDGLSEAGANIDVACEGCHMQFWYPPQQ
jgi:hypothetical protein